MSVNEWEVNLWPNYIDCPVVYPPSAPSLRVLSASLCAGGQSLLLASFQEG